MMKTTKALEVMVAAALAVSLLGGVVVGYSFRDFTPTNVAFVLLAFVGIVLVAAALVGWWARKRRLL